MKGKFSARSQAQYDIYQKGLGFLFLISNFYGTDKIFHAA